MLKAINLSTGAVIGDAIRPAFSFWTRFRGLLGCRGLENGEGLLLYPCSSIHCLGMRFSIDAIFLDGNHQVLLIRENMKPGALAFCRGARYVLELAVGQARARQISVGYRLSFQEKAYD